jgi:hypothetical protein
MKFQINCVIFLSDFEEKEAVTTRVDAEEAHEDNEQCCNH